MTEIFSGEIRVPTIQDFSSVFTVTQVNEEKKKKKTIEGREERRREKKRA